MKAKTLFCFLLLHFQVVQAQEITGTVTDPASAPLAGANVVLLSRADSSWVQGTACTQDGKFSFNSISPGPYLLGFSIIGYKLRYLPVNLSGSKTDVGNVTMEPDETLLSEVQVKAYKPLFEQKIDRMVVNVQNSITSVGGNVLEVLQRSPGILVNREQGTLSMSGKDGVNVMINGKMNYMPATALMSMLEGMNAAIVEKIELITTPPAKYDAGGNAGYINIVLRQTPDAGFNGGYALTAGAFYGHTLNGTFDFNYRRGRTNLYGGLGSSGRGQAVDFYLYRQVRRQSGTYENISTSRRDGRNFDNNIRLGYDYEFSKKVIAGVLVSGYNNRWDMEALNRVERVSNGTLDTTLVMQVKETNRWKNAMANLNLLIRPESGSELTFNIDYLFYDNHNPINYNNDYFKGREKYLFTRKLLSSKDSRLRILPVQLDYSRKLNDKLSFETGLKMVHSGLTNDVLVAWHEPSGWITDPAFTVNATLKEKYPGRLCLIGFFSGR